MAWDVKATADGVAGSMPDLSGLTQGMSLSGTANWIMIAVLVLGVATILMKLVPRIWAAIEEAIFTNWHLAVLGASALALSVAGAYTTWDGMKNFTGEPVLSVMFTFGIHGVMLIAAWLIGESFATGMNQVRHKTGRTLSPPAVALSLLGGGLLIAGAAMAAVRMGVSENQLLVGSMTAGAALLLIATMLLFSKSDIVQPYAQGIRIIIKNSMLWVMFLACMATSVFFSFDSRFHVIFPADQRVRAAEIRSKNQVAGVVADIGTTIGDRRMTEAQHLFESDGWKAYDAELEKLSKASEGADALVEDHFTKQMEAHRASIAEQQERMTTAVSGQAGLQSKKTSLTDELSRLKADRPALAAELATKKGELDTRAKEVDAKRVEAMAEDKGVEGTLKSGRGPMYRQRMDELAKLKDYYKIGEERVRDAEKRLSTVDTRVAAIERELAGVDGELAKLQGEAQTADQRIKAAEGSKLGQEGEKIDPARVRGAFERARLDFRQDPNIERLATLNQHCVQLYDAMISTEATKDRVRNIDCDPKQATEAAAALFALNAGQKSFEQNCSGGDKLPADGGVDSLLGFGRKCLQDSGLSTKDSNEVAARISAIDLNRDDKAHSFVVSLNAFQDGNRLAYLALAIAIGIDSLIFMSGLFGANAVRSPLSDLPSLKARNSQQLNAMIETALLPDTFRKARLVVAAMHPIENTEGYSNEVRLNELDAETANDVRSVLNAGAIIGAVKRIDVARYLVRSELLEFLNVVIKQELERNGVAARRGLELDQLEDQMSVALLPEVGANCDRVMQEFSPIDEQAGFTSEVFLDDLPEDVRPPMLNVLNAAATFQVVQRDKAEADRYYIHKDLYKVLSRIRARELARGVPYYGAARPPLPPRFGGEAKGAAPQAVASASVARPQLANPNADQVPTPQEMQDARHHYLAALLASVGIEPASFLDLSGPAYSAAVQASEAFQHARKANRALDQEFEDRIDEHHKSLDDAYERLRSAIKPTEEWKRQQLDEAFAEVANSWSVLMLLPNGPCEALLHQIVEQLESDNGAGSLSQEDSALYNGARRLVEALGRNARDTDAAWMQLEHVFHQAARPQTQAALSDVKRALN